MAGRQDQVVVPDAIVDKWRIRLTPYRGNVLFLWQSLSFTSSPLSAVAVWAPVHLTIGFLFSDSTTVLVLLGNILLMMSIFYALLHFAVKYFCSGPWTAAQNEQFDVICCDLGYLELVLRYLADQLLQKRKTTPWKFYIGWLAVALVISEVGRWISTGLAVQLVASVFLLVPVALEHGWLREGRAEQVVPAARTFKDTLVGLVTLYWRETRSKVTFYWREMRLKISRYRQARAHAAK